MSWKKKKKTITQDTISGARKSTSDVWHNYSFFSSFFTKCFSILWKQTNANPSLCHWQSILREQLIDGGSSSLPLLPGSLSTAPLCLFLLVLSLLSGGFSTAVCPVSLVLNGWRCRRSLWLPHTKTQFGFLGGFFVCFFRSACFSDNQHTSSPRQTHTQIALWLDWRKDFQVLFVVKWFHVRRMLDCRSLMIDTCWCPYAVNGTIRFHCIVTTR